MYAETRNKASNTFCIERFSSGNFRVIWISTNPFRPRNFDNFDGVPLTPDSVPEFDRLFATDGMPPMGCDIYEGPQNEGAKIHARMRYYQSGSRLIPCSQRRNIPAPPCDHLPVGQQIQIERARRPTKSPPPPTPDFYPRQIRQQRRRPMLRADRGDRIDIILLAPRTNSRRLVKPRCCLHNNTVFRQ